MTKRFAAVLGVFVAVASVFALSFAEPVSAKTEYDTRKCPTRRILFYPAWYDGMKCQYEKGKADQIPSPKIEKLNDIWAIVLNIVQWVIITVGYIAVFFIVVGGFKYMTARGDPQQIVAAKNTIFQAIIGLVIAMLSTAIVVAVQAAIVSGRAV